MPPPRADEPGLPHVAEAPDQAIARIAGGQRGLVTRGQLDALGLGRGAIEHRLKQRRLHAIHRGVYLVGHPVPLPLARELAAVLSSGPGALVSHHSAARLWSFVSASRPGVDVTVPGRDLRSRAGVRQHQVNHIDPRDTTTQHDIPVTTPARTLVDLAGALGSRELGRAVEQARIQGLTDPRRITAALGRSPNRRGAGALRALLEREREPSLKRSEAEERVVGLVRSAGLPPPSTNARVGRHEVDLYWPSQRLVVEVDGYAFHSSHTAFERDRAGDAELAAAGVRVVRVTWRQAVEQPAVLVARIAQALVHARG